MDDESPAAATAQDMARLFELERAGHFPAGYTVRGLAAGAAYIDRILWLRAKYAVEKYPGPTATVSGLL